MLRKIVALLALFAALFPGCAFADTSDEPLAIGAKAAILMEAETGRVLLEKNADQRLPMASTTKIMTCLLALENSSLEETVTVGKNAAGVTGTSLYLSQGETLTMEQMLYGLMLRSGNDAAVAIAEHVDGSVEEFVARMNRRAVELGADAQFKNPHGLDQQGHEASARAMALILRECLKNETFARISSTKEKVIPWPGNEYSRVLKNKNRLLTSDMYPQYWTVSIGGIYMKYSYEYKKDCVELYRHGKWPETPEGVSPDRFHHAVVEWNRLEKTCGLEALQHKNQNKVWTAEEKYELVAKVLAGASKMETAISAGISTGLLYQWVRCYKMKGYQGLASQRKGRPPKEPDMKKKVAPAELTPSEREEMILLRAENERLRAEIAVVKKEIALREERCAAQLKAKRLRSSKNCVKKDTD